MLYRIVENIQRPYTLISPSILTTCFVSCRSDLFLHISQMLVRLGYGGFGEWINALGSLSVNQSINQSTHQSNIINTREINRSWALSKLSGSIAYSLKSHEHINIYKQRQKNRILDISPLLLPSCFSLLHCNHLLPHQNILL